MNLSLAAEVLGSRGRESRIAQVWSTGFSPTTSDLEKEKNKQRDQQYSNPCSLQELEGSNDDERYSRRKCSYPVQDRLRPPTLACLRRQ